MTYANLKTAMLIWYKYVSHLFLDTIVVDCFP